MKQIKLLALLLFVCNFGAFAQESYKETFDANSFDWTEAPKMFAGPSARIEEGVMKVEVSGNILSAANQFAETHCYAPLDIQKPFTIKSNVIIKNLPITGFGGLLLNYRDNGTFYLLRVDLVSVAFCRYVDGKEVGSIVQPMSWDGKRKDRAQEWVLISDNQTLKFLVNGEPVLNVRYMPLEYAGVGFYAFGKGYKFWVDDIEFIQ